MVTFKGACWHHDKGGAAVNDDFGVLAGGNVRAGVLLVVDGELLESEMPPVVAGFGVMIV